MITSNKLLQQLAAGAIGGMISFATGMLSIASSMSATDTLASIATKDWITVCMQAMAAALTTWAGYMVISPKSPGG